MKLRGIKTKIAAAVFILIILISALNFFQQEVRGFFYSISSPFQKKLWQTGGQVSDFFESVFRRQEIKDELEAEKRRNQDFLYRLGILQGLAKENEELRKALDIGIKKDFQLILVQVIGRDVSQDTILIDKGFTDGAEKDMPVITSEKILVGKVSEVSKNFSKIALISNAKSIFDAEIQEKNISGVIKGKGGSKIIFDRVSPDKDAANGDIIITSGIGGIFPRGLLAAYVRTAEKNGVDPFQTIELEPLKNISDVNFLFLIKN